MSAHSINTGSLYQRLLGKDFDRLPAPIQALHGSSEGGTFSGRGQILAAEHPLARCIAWCTGLPTRSMACSVTVHIERDGDGEIWRRQFDTHRFHSRLFASNGFLIEKLGPHRITFLLEVTEQLLRMRPVGWRMLGVPLPRFLWPKIDAEECVHEGLFQFKVATSFPWIGRVVDYRGSLTPNSHND